MWEGQQSTRRGLCVTSEIIGAGLRLAQQSFLVADPRVVSPRPSLRRSAVRWKPIGGARSVQSVFWATPYRMLRKIKDQSNAPMNCTSVRAMVAKLRQDGFSAGEVEQGLPAILVDLYGER